MNQDVTREESRPVNPRERDPRGFASVKSSAVIREDPRPVAQKANRIREDPRPVGKSSAVIRGAQR